MNACSLGQRGPSDRALGASLVLAAFPHTHQPARRKSGTAPRLFAHPKEGPVCPESAMAAQNPAVSESETAGAVERLPATFLPGRVSGCSSSAPAAVQLNPTARTRRHSPTRRRIRPGRREHNRRRGQKAHKRSPVGTTASPGRLHISRRIRGMASPHRLARALSCRGPPTRR